MTRTETSLSDYLAAGRDEVEKALDRALTDLERVAPVELMPAIRHGVKSGGKRLRPLLLATAYRECDGGGPTDALFDLAVSVELIHAYSLMHDDLPCMDDAPLRRGEPTPHTIHGVEPTTRGALLLIPWAARSAYEGSRALGAGDATAKEVTVELMEAAGSGGMVGGQALDLLAEGQQIPSEQLRQLHGLKTGALLAASLRMGALAAGAPARQCEAVHSFGLAIGLAFQIIDDVLDATSTEDALGKRPSDQEMSKSTYVALYGVEGAREEGRAAAHRGVQALDDVGLAAPRLRQLADYVVQRGH